MDRRDPFSAALVAILAGGVLAWASLAAASERKVVVYPVAHRMAAELLPLAESLIGPSGSATLDSRTNAILLVGPEEEVASTLEILRAQDRPLRTVLVRQEWMQRSALVDAGVEVRWSVGSGDFRVGRILPPPGDDRLAIEAHAEFRAAHEARAVQLRVVEGAHSRIETGSVVPYASPSAADPDAAARAKTTWVDVTTGLATDARILGDGRIRLDLSPFQSSLEQGGAIARMSATTVLELEPGEIRVLGGSRRQSTESRSESGRGTRTDHGDEDLVLIVSAVIESKGDGIER